VVKGDLVVVTGKLKTDEWQDRDSGQKRSKIVLIADTVSVSLAFRQIPHGSSSQSGSRPEQLRPQMPVQSAYSDTPPPFYARRAKAWHGSARSGQPRQGMAGGGRAWMGEVRCA